MNGKGREKEREREKRREMYREKGGERKGILRECASVRLYKIDRERVKGSELNRQS